MSDLHGLTRGIGLLVLLLVFITACGGSPGDDELTIFAAASLTEAFTDVGEAFEAEHDASLSFNFAGSQALVTQLAEGADADIFASANLEQMQRASEAGVLSGNREIFARNKLVIIVPAGNPAAITRAEDLAGEGLKIAVAAEDVPAGRYTREMFDLLAASPNAPAGFIESVEANIVSNDSNVRQVVTKVQLGEADAGVVYATDVTANVRHDVHVIEIPDQFNVLADYPVATVEGANQGSASAFIDYLLSEPGQEILQQYGFIPPAT